MTHIDRIIILAGLGSPAFLYESMAKKLRDQFPHAEVHLLAWWNERDFGEASLRKLLENKFVILVGHSAGGVIAIKSLVEFPDWVKRVVMLDSHFLHGKELFPPVDDLLKPMLAEEDPEIAAQVIEAYAPVFNDSQFFYSALKFCVDWINVEFENACSTVKKMKPHTALLIGFTDSNYQILDNAHKAQIKTFWNQYGVDTEFLPINHFGLISSDSAEAIVTKVTNWL